MTSRLDEWYDHNMEATRQALAQHPGPCEVTYYVFGTKYTKTFDFLLDAFKWVADRERHEAQSTSHYTLEDGSTLKATIAAWHVADEYKDEDLWQYRLNLR